MTRPRGRPVQGKGVTRDEILTAAMNVLDESGGKGLTMRILAERLGVTPMSLYHHVGDQAGLLRALSDRVNADVLKGVRGKEPPRGKIRDLLTRYHQAVGRHPQLTLAIFTASEPVAGVTRQITDRLVALLREITSEPMLWCEILVDHAHGSGLALVAAKEKKSLARNMQKKFQQALNRLLDCMEA